ncbi:MAG: mechanosensitive ion channel family protein [Deltaproteobacteria bacterium]|nr:MAG: mechanosensitive ion channel family protein [Deltaproteobacteria bacterium]
MADDVLAEVLSATRPWVLAVVAVVLGARSLVLPDAVAWVLRAALTVAIALQIALWGNCLLARWIAARQGAAAGAGATGYAAVHFIARLLLWSLVALLALDNLGIDVTALVASLGVGGIAVALAVQNILGDIFCSLSIVFDRPFEVGDFIIVDDLMGTVEQIGIKTTRIRSLGGEQLVFSNSDLVGSRIRNYKRMWERRVVFSFGVTYQTPPEKLERLCDIVREIVGGIEDARLDRVHFARFGDSALVFEVVYYVRKPDYNVYMDVQQAINLSLMRRCREEGVEFAYPTQTLYVQQCEPAEVHGGRDAS